MRVERDERVIEEFRRRKSRLYFVVFPVVVIALLVLLVVDPTLPKATANVLGPVSVAVMLGAVVYSWIIWRCPSCNRYLGRSGAPKYCPSCGAQLQ